MPERCYLCEERGSESYPLKKIQKDSASGGGGTLWIHEVACPVRRPANRPRTYPT